MPEWLADLPFAVIYAVMFTASMVRGQTVYWIGRGINRLGTHSKQGWAERFRGKMSSPEFQRALDIVRRRGWPAVTLAHLTVGLQTLLIASAGVVRMRWLVFLAAQIPGSLMWALVYSTIGWAAFQSLAWAAMKSPVGTFVVAVLGMAAIVWWFSRGRRRGGSDLTDLEEDSAG